MKNRKIKRKEADDAAMSFVLSLLTVGVAGAAAGPVGKLIVATEGSRQDAAKDIVKQVIKSAGGAVSGAAVNALSPEKATDIFAPSDVDPLDYMLTVRSGFTYRNAVLLDILHEVKWDPKTTIATFPDFDHSTQSVGITHTDDGRLTLSAAKLLTETLLATSYFRQAPAPRVKYDDLLTKARLALWIGYALNRDADYWSDGEQNFDAGYYCVRGGCGPAKDISKATAEQVDWVAVRDDLAVNLNVPPGMVTSTLKVGRVTQYGLYMWGFMTWASSTQAIDLLLDGVESESPIPGAMVRSRASRQILTPKTIEHPHWMPVPQPEVTSIGPEVTPI